MANPGIFKGMDIRNQVEFFLFRSLVYLLQSGSETGVQELFGRLGIWLGSVPRYRRTVVLKQLAAVYPQISNQELDSLADDIYEHLGRTVAEVFGPGLEACADSATISPGWGPIDQALGLGKGAIVATGHIGNFELGGLLLARRYSLLDVVKRQRNRIFDEFINDLRARRGILTVPMERSGPAVLRHLRSGGLVSLLLDQDAGAEGLEVDFLGHAASTWPGVARLSLRTGCPVIPMAIVRQPDRSHRLMIADPLYPQGLADSRRDVQVYLQRISLAVEYFIRENPRQWFWVHRRWKSASANRIDITP